MTDVEYRLGYFYVGYADGAAVLRVRRMGQLCLALDMQ